MWLNRFIHGDYILDQINAKKVVDYMQMQDREIQRMGMVINHLRREVDGLREENIRFNGSDSKYYIREERKND